MYHIIDENGQYYATAGDDQQLANLIRILRRDENPHTKARSSRIVHGGAVVGFWNDMYPIQIWRALQLLEIEDPLSKEHYLDSALADTVQTVQTVQRKEAHDAR